MQQRYYDPLAGRFLSVDPIVTDANTGKGFGLCTYVDNNPYAKIDPDGREPGDIARKIEGWETTFDSKSGDSANSPAQAAGAPISGSTPDEQKKGAAAIDRFFNGNCGKTVNCLTFTPAEFSGGRGLASKIFTATGELKASATAAAKLQGRPEVSNLAIREAVAFGERAADPQGVAGRFMYYIEAAGNTTRGRLEVLVNEITNTVGHALYKKGPY